MCKYLDYQTGNYNSEKSDSAILAKTAPGFLDNLNAKLAEQRAPNKAYAVRSYINSKVVVSSSQCTLIFFPFDAKKMYKNLNYQNYYQLSSAKSNSV